MLEWVWIGYDHLKRDLGTAIAAASDAADLERDITQLLEPRVRAAMPDFVPFYVQHGVFERESRQAPPAQPPCYDLAFVSYSNPRLIWPLEAKVLKHEGDVRRYVAEVNEQFLTCRYAPFNSEAAMLAYLLRGDAFAALIAIEDKLGVELAKYAPQPERPHRLSRHERLVPEGKEYPRQFGCHHLIMRFFSGAQL